MRKYLLALVLGLAALTPVGCKSFHHRETAPPPVATVPPPPASIVPAPPPPAGPVNPVSRVVARPAYLP